jgi:hypothetical protein
MRRERIDYAFRNMRVEPMDIVANRVMCKGDVWACYPILFETETGNSAMRVRNGKLHSGEVLRGCMLKVACEPLFERGALEVILNGAEPHGEIFQSDSAFVDNPITCEFAQCK